MIPSSQELRHHYRFTDFLFYLCLLSIPVILSFTVILEYSVQGAIVFGVLGLCLVLVMLRFFCTRCPHYCRDAKTLKCIFFWGLPKVFEPRPGKLTTTEILISLGAPGVFFLVPVFWLVREPGLLVVYGLSLAGFAASIYRNECRQCIHVECPANRVR